MGMGMNPLGKVGTGNKKVKGKQPAMSSALSGAMGMN